jgi:uncharacterized protein (DUF2342 family)
MSSTTGTASATSASASSTSTDVFGTAQSDQGISLVAFITALTTALIIFGVQMFAFIALKEKLARILCVFTPSPWLVSLLILLVNPKPIWSPKKNGRSLHPERHGVGSLPYFGSETEKL